MILYDKSRCTNCGICLRLRGGYCLEKKDDGIDIDYAVCNECQKCVAICPAKAFTNDGVPPVRIEKPLAFGGGDFMDLLRRRRSIRHFKDQKLPKELLGRIVEAACYAPTMNKAIEAVVIDDQALVGLLDSAALRFYNRAYGFLFGFRPLTAFMGLFSRTLPVVKKKMDHDLKVRKHIVKDKTQALILLIGDKKVPMTEISAQYDMANMILFCEASGLGSCLMDSLKIVLNNTRSLKNRLHIPRRFKILCVLAVGYPEEKILNLPEGPRMKTGFNMRSGDTV
jgi:nitroreductase/NAD-dependent dihydropyrimidine dehydrogenase PreA subunit